jgi:hypothetical protein
MKPKLFKTKPIIALALTLFMVVSMLFVALPSVKASPNTTPVLSVVPDGAPGATGTTQIAGVAVGSTFTVDIRVDNIASISEGINGLSYSLTYNPAVLSVTGYHTKQTSFWGSTAAGDLTAIVTQTPAGTFTESSVIVPSGLANESTTTPGVATTITFKALTTGESSLNFQPSDIGQPYLTYPDNEGASHAVTANVEDAVYNQLYTQMFLYQAGTSSSIVQFAPGTDPIGNTFTLDLNMSNALAEPIWGWNVGVNWNPAVLQLQTVTEGTYMNTSPGLYAGSSTLFVQGHIDNTHGTIEQGISDVYLSNTTTTAEYGTLAILTFKVINYANSSITLTAGSPTLINNYGQSETCNLNNAEYVTLPPPPATAPTAVITNGAASTMYLPGAPITLNGLSSTPGTDVIPNPTSPSFPITSYTWTEVSGPTISSFPMTGGSISFSAPSPASGPFTIELTVATARNPSDPSYVNTGSTTITFSPAYINPTTAGAQINVYIVNPTTATTTNPIKSPTGLGYYNVSAPGPMVDTFAPQQLMTLNSFVTFNGAAVADKLVTFTVTADGNPSDVVYTTTAYTNANGIAVATYRLPNYDSGVMPFGDYTVTASVDVAQVLVSDSFSFQYNYVLTISNVAVPGETAQGQVATTAVTITDNSLSAQSYYLTWTVTDANDVPVVYGATSGITTGVTTAINNIQLSIPTYAFVGTATLHVNLYDANPVTGQGVPYCAEYDVTFTIAIPATQQIVPP